MESMRMRRGSLTVAIEGRVLHGGGWGTNCAVAATAVLGSVGGVRRQRRRSWMAEEELGRHG